MKIKYSILVVLIFLEALILPVSLFHIIKGPAGVHRRAMDNAWYEWKTNPTPETERKMKHERTITATYDLILNSIPLFILVINTVGIVYMIRRIRNEGRQLLIVSK